MYQVLIVEDNALIRRGIISAIDWQVQNCVLAAEADNGGDAVRLLEECCPDIVLTDVKMPGMDGLQLLDHIAEHFPEIQTIVISGYDNFAFVRHAVQRASVDYLLKPIRRDELNQAIAKACRLLARPAAQEDPHFLIRALLLDALHGNYPTSGALPSRAQPLLAGKKYCLLAFRPQHPHLLKMVQNGLRSYEEYSFYLFEEPELYQLVAVFDTEAQYERLPRLLSGLAEAFEQALMLPVSFGISAFCPDLFSLHSIEAQARTALLQHLLISDKRVFRWQSALEAASPDRLPFYEDRLLSALIAGDAAQAVELCSAALYELAAHDGASACDLHMQLLQIYCTLLKIDCPCRAMIEREINELSLRSLLRFDSINVLLEHIAALCRLICAQILQSRSATTALVESVRKYIDEHYGSHITLQVLAELFHVNASYLSQIFKRQIGVGVNRYLRGARLSAAKRMLAGTDGRLSDICMQCGFSDYVHFSKTFKEEFGLSPSDYRKNH